MRDTTSHMERVLFAFTLAAAVIFMAVGLQRPVWLDEANSILIASGGITGIVDGLSRDNNLPAYYLVLSLWMRIFGDSEMAVQSLSVAFYAAGCAAAWVFGRRVANDARNGWYAAMFYACSRLAIEHAHNVRMYSLLGALAAASGSAFVRLFRDRDDSWGAVGIYVGVNAVGFLTHYWFVFVIGAQCAVLLLFWPRAFYRFAAMVTAAAMAFVLLWGPHLQAQIHSGATAWMPHIWRLLVVREFLDFYGPVAVFIYVAAAATCSLAVFRGRGGTIARVRVPALLFLLSFCLPLLVSTVKPIFWPGRYMVIAVGPLAVALATVLTATLPRPLLIGFCFSLVSFQTVTHSSREQDRRRAEEGTPLEARSERATARLILEHSLPGDAVVFTSLTRATADYYFRLGKADGRFVEVSFPAEVARHLGWFDPVTHTAAERVALENEADAIARQMQGIVARGGRVWMYDGSGQVTQILRSRLDAVLPAKLEYRSKGPYHSRLVAYVENHGEVAAER